MKEKREGRRKKKTKKKRIINTFNNSLSARRVSTLQIQLKIWPRKKKITITNIKVTRIKQKASIVSIKLIVSSLVSFEQSLWLVIPGLERRVFFWGNNYCFFLIKIQNRKKQFQASKHTKTIPSCANAYVPVIHELSHIFELQIIMKIIEIDYTHLILTFHKQIHQGSTSKISYAYYWSRISLKASTSLRRRGYR